VLIHSIGARSGAERLNPALSVKETADRLVIASAAGRPNNPGWYHNLRAHPDITIETPEGAEQVTAIELDGDQYAAAWTRFDAQSPAFGQYQKSAGSRRLPIFRLQRRSPSSCAANASRVKPLVRPRFKGERP
jgi:deazaflavin-dependent oxidoreductase (nitroreductase family)